MSPDLETEPLPNVSNTHGPSGNKKEPFTTSFQPMAISFDDTINHMKIAPNMENMDVDLEESI